MGLSHHTILRFKRAWVSRPLSGKMTLARFLSSISPRTAGAGGVTGRMNDERTDLEVFQQCRGLVLGDRTLAAICGLILATR